jgi:hypothetical protein
MKQPKLTTLILSTLLSAAIGLPAASAQTELVNGKYRVVLKLNDNNFTSLKNSGYVRAEVPKSQRDKIVAVKIVKQGSFIDEPIEIAAESLLSRGVLSIRITNAILEQIEFRPVLVKVTENGFSKVLLDYQTAKMDPSESEETAPPLPQLDDTRRFFVRRDEGNGIVAWTPEASVLSLKTDYGNYDVPWAQIEAVHLGQADAVSVIFRNGDKISGQLNQPTINLITAWGDHDVEAGRLFSFTRSSEQKFMPANSPNGVKYLLYGTTDDRQSAGY